MAQQEQHDLHSRPLEHLQKQQRFMALLEPYHSQLSRFAHALTMDSEDGHDLLADTILRAYESLETVRDDDAFGSYIFTIARRLYYRRVRRSKWWGVLDRDVAERLPDHRSVSLETRVDTTLLDAAMMRLPDKQREAIILFEISGFSLEEIRTIQGGTLSGVKSRIVRGRTRLERMLTDRVWNSDTSVSREASGNSFQRVQIALLSEEKP